jgi:hypothetical protein
MTEITVRFNLTFSRRFVMTTAAAAMMLCAVPELDSESVTLSTYYPAPSGVYTNMITTGNTYLARDGGAGTRLGVGTTVPGAKLDVSGDARIQRLETTGANAITGADPHSADMVVGSDAGVRHDSSIIMWSAASALRVFSSNDVLKVNTWNQAAGTYNVALGAATGANSTFGGPVIYQGPNCVLTPYALGVANCPAGQYVTFTQGYMTKYTTSGGTTDPAGTMLCCSCPVGGCPGL